MVMAYEARLGGYQGPRGYVYEVTGGEICLDFTNTLEGRPTGRREDRLVSYEELLNWAGQAGVLTLSEQKQLHRRVVNRKKEADRVLEQAKELRAALFDLFRAYNIDRSFPPVSVEILNRYLIEAFRHRRLEPAPKFLSWNWVKEDVHLKRILWPVALSAATILTSERLERVRVCSSETCDWLFLDESRNQTRRWCNMLVCGNRQKARLHYRRKKRAANRLSTTRK